MYVVMVFVKTHFVGENCIQKQKNTYVYSFLEGFTQIITILHRGVIEIYDNTTWEGGLPDFLQYHIRGAGGSLLVPQSCIT